MRAIRPGVVIALLVVIGLGLVTWSVYEARRQRQEIEEALAAEASLLARSLGPGLAAASSSLRELDELVTWRLLDNARLLAELLDTGALTPLRLDRLAEENDLDAVVVTDPRGEILLGAGDAVPAEDLERLDEILERGADEIILGSRVTAGVERIAAAVKTGEGGAMLVRVHPSSARTFGRQLGVENLLDSLVGSGGVLYLSYREEPAGIDLESSWDGGPAPAISEEGPALQTVRDRSVFEIVVPVDSPAGSRASLRVGLDGAPLNRAATSAARRTLLVGIVLTGFGLALAGFAIVSRLRAEEREEATIRLRAAEEARRRSERLAAAGALTAGLAHEVRSPLNAIGLAAQRIERRYPQNEQCSEFARRIRDEVLRLENVLRQFLGFARPVKRERETVSLAEIAGEVIGLLEDEARQAGVRLEPVQGDARASVDREAVRRSLINLISNAVQSSPDGGSVRTLVDASGGMARLRVLDSGVGLEGDIEEKVFEAFFTTRASGSGLGLSLVRRIAEEHGGECAIRNREEGGAEATIRFPLDEGEAR